MLELKCSVSTLTLLQAVYLEEFIIMFTGISVVATSIRSAYILQRPRSDMSDVSTRLS